MSGYPANMAHAHSGLLPFPAAGSPSPHHHHHNSSLSAAAPAPNTLEALIAPLHYTDKPRLLSDLASLLTQTNSLTPHLAPLPTPPNQPNTHSPPQLLLSLTGTVPIYYKHVEYHIPIAIFLPLHYPLHPPAVYVTPTSDMRIKERHKHVDSAGVVYLPYLHEWNGRDGGSMMSGGGGGDGSGLVELLSVMSSTFSDDPPVFKVGVGGGGSQGGGVPHHDKSPQSKQQQHPPPLPHHSHSSPVIGSRPLPPVPSAASPPVHPSVASASPSSLALPSIAQPSRSPTPEPLSPSSSLRQSLLSSLTKRSQELLHTQHREMSSQIDSILSQQQLLSQRREQHDTTLATLQSELTQLTQHTTTLTTAHHQLTHWLATHEQPSLASDSNPTAADELVYPRDSWSRQLLECVVADTAVDDALWLLDRALAEGVVEFGVYVKLVRAWSRKQYFHRALAVQIQRRQAEAKQQQQQQQAVGVGGGGGAGLAAGGVRNAVRR